MINKICVAGAGTMGSGIALAAAQSSYEVVLFDSNEAVLEKAKASVLKNLSFLVDKQKISAAEKEQVFSKILFTGNIADCTADLVIEAIVEIMDAKVNLFKQLAALNNSNTIFASNTSSLSINTLQQQLPHSSRVAGMHFFNPANVMKLVEVVKAEQTDPAVTEALMEVCRKMNKVPVLCKDAPGFIVNRVARHYYLESMRSVENDLAGFETVDAIMEASGFKMGPFRLMDMIGMDINLAVSRSLYEAFDHEPRFEPSPLQIEKVANGDLGKKTGKGFYNYTNENKQP
ncbi:MAG: 3-hydroxybutyryl-CoA dehydrogenase [Bacteroidetes bacterium]|nr:3-hydroxybutyryl-CoA dehydrogenase [Bacteroidota bacterium]